MPLDAPFGRRGGRWVGIAPAAMGVAYDYLVTSDAEWNTVFGNSDATLSGKTIALDGTNFTRRTITDRQFSPALTIMGLSGAALPGLTLAAVSADLSGLTLRDFGTLYTAWPKAVNSVVTFEPGSGRKVSDILFDGIEFAHGYTDGAGGVQPINPSANLDEYNRVENGLATTTSSVAHALSWQDGSAPGWNRVTVFNNSATDTIAVKFGTSAAVTAAFGTTGAAGDNHAELAPGASAIVQPGDTGIASTTLPTHVAVISDGTESYVSQTSGVNARTEIGLALYLARAVGASGAGVTENIAFRDCYIHDAADGVKGLNLSGTFEVFRCRFYRIYQDVLSFGVATGIPATTIHVVANDVQNPFARSGTAQSENGDAADPHSDSLIQIFGDATSVDRGPIYIYGNTVLHHDVRTGVGSQGVWLSDMPGGANGVFVRVEVAENFLDGGAGNSLAVSMGEDILVQYNTVVSWSGADTAGLVVGNINDKLGAIVNNIAENYSALATADTGDAVTAKVQEGNVNVGASSNAHTSVFVDWTTYATTQALVKTNLIADPAGPAVGTGFGATSAVNYNAANAVAAIDRSELVPVWLHLVQDELTASTQYATEVARVMGIPDGSTVTPGAGVEVQIHDTDLTTIETAWTGSATTMDNHQGIALRATTEATAATVTELQCTVAGKTRSAYFITSATAYDVATADGDDYMTRSGVPSGSPPSAAKQFVFAFDGVFLGASNDRIYKIGSLVDIYGLTDGTLRIDAFANNCRVRIAGALSTTTEQPQQVVVSVDTTQANAYDGIKCWVDNVPKVVTEVTTWTQDATADFSASASAYVLHNAASNIAEAEAGLIYFDPLASGMVDVDDAEIRAKFLRDNIGATGAGPSGSQPFDCLYGAASVWEAGTNKGYAGNFTATGTFASFSEAAVTTSGTSELSRASGIATDNTKLLISLALTPGAAPASTQRVMQVNGLANYIQWNTNGTLKLLWKNDSAATIINANGSINVASSKAHVLISIDGTAGTFTTYIKKDSGSWTQDTGLTSTFTAFTTEKLDLDSGSLILFDGYAGTVHRIGAWAGQAPDVSSGTVQGYFESGGTVVDPATAVAQYGTQSFDAYLAASDYNSGAPGVGAFTSTTGFVDA